MNNDRWEVSEVWFCAEEQSWVVTAYDYDGNIVGESDYSYLKVDAIDTAEMYLQSDRCGAVKIFTKDGRLQRTIKNK
tara:strand:- start:1095 stop:1325 length:231 start_codon:yes stop_codon:yes gene_type:complete